MDLANYVGSAPFRREVRRKYEERLGYRLRDGALLIEARVVLSYEPAYRFIVRRVDTQEFWDFRLHAASVYAEPTRLCSWVVDHLKPTPETRPEVGFSEDGRSA